MFETPFIKSSDRVDGVTSEFEPTMESSEIDPNLPCIEIVTDTFDSNDVQVFIDGNYCNVITGSMSKRVRLPHIRGWAHEFFTDPVTEKVGVRMVAML
jgi:hypothetical protein